MLNNNNSSNKSGSTEPVGPDRCSVKTTRIRVGISVALGVAARIAKQTALTDRVGITASGSASVRLAAAPAGRVSTAERAATAGAEGLLTGLTQTAVSCSDSVARHYRRFFLVLPGFYLVLIEFPSF